LSDQWKKEPDRLCFQPNISFKELLQNIFQELNIDPKTGDINQMVTVSTT